jgi:sRNA-binding carbon storage regulator CsrA
MLILSRGVNEAVVLADQVIITLIRLLSDRVELTIRATAGGPSAPVEVRRGESTDLGLGARVTLVEVLDASVCGGPKARLGFEAPLTVSVYRKETWDVTGGRGPDWYSPKLGTAPSSN